VSRSYIVNAAASSRRQDTSEGLTSQIGHGVRLGLRVPQSANEDPIDRGDAPANGPKPIRKIALCDVASSKVILIWSHTPRARVRTHHFNLTSLRPPITAATHSPADNRTKYR
jgi:hypothetical protein